VIVRVTYVLANASRHRTVASVSWRAA